MNKSELIEVVAAKTDTSKAKTGEILDALTSILSNDRTYFEKLVSSLYPLLERLKVADAVSGVKTARSK